MSWTRIVNVMMSFLNRWIASGLGVCVWWFIYFFELVRDWLSQVEITPPWRVCGEKSVSWLSSCGPRDELDPKRRDLITQFFYIKDKFAFNSLPWFSMGCVCYCWRWNVSCDPISLSLLTSSSLPRTKFSSWLLRARVKLGQKPLRRSGGWDIREPTVCGCGRDDY